MQEIEENKKFGKTRDLFKKIRDTKGAFHAKMGIIKDTNGMYGPNKRQKISKRGSRNTQKNYTEKFFITEITTVV